MKLFLAPHNDDEALYGAYTIMREKPLVVVCTDGYIQAQKGHTITAEERIEETKKAMAILGAEVEFLHIPDTELTIKVLIQALKKYKGISVCYAPALQGGNLQHDMVGRAANSIFLNVIHYATYTRTNLVPIGDYAITPTQKEKELKYRALQCYTSQLKINAPHFTAVYDVPEYYA